MGRGLAPTWLFPQGQVWWLHRRRRSGSGTAGELGWGGSVQKGEKSGVDGQAVSGKPAAQAYTRAVLASGSPCALVVWLCDPGSATLAGQTGMCSKQEADGLVRVPHKEARLRMVKEMGIFNKVAINTVSHGGGNCSSERESERGRARMETQVFLTPGGKPKLYNSHLFSFSVGIAQGRGNTREWHGFGSCRDVQWHNNYKEWGMHQELNKWENLTLSSRVLGQESFSLDPLWGQIQRGH